MLDIKFIREHVDEVKENMLRKNRTDVSLIDDVLSLDEKYRSLLTQEQDLRSQRNKLSEQVNKEKKAGNDITPLIAQVKAIPAQIKELTEQTTALKGELRVLLKKIPNIMHANVPPGVSDDDNVELRQIGSFVERDVKPHQEITESLGLSDFESSATTSGNGFYYIQGDLALLNQALLRFATEIMVKNGFTYVETPLMIRKDIVENVVSLADQDEQIYKIENEDLYLIGTSEHSLIGRYVQKTVEESQLPLLQTSYSMCFRREKGSHGLDERGLFRTHQFNKIEMIAICKPAESLSLYKKLQDITLDIFTQLEIPIRVLQICAGDLGDLKHDQVDIEAYSPRKKGWIEVGSCSNLTDAQARMLGITVKSNVERYTPHTLNNTAIATSRALVAILENNQNEDGTVTIPQVLVPYMFGKTQLEASK